MMDAEMSTAGAPLDAGLRARLAELHDEGQEIWARFDREQRLREWHPFVPADYESVLASLLELRQPGLRFLEWGSATGVIAITADLLGFDASGIEIDGGLVEVARDLAARYRSGARFAAGSFLPAGYMFRSASGDRRLGTIGQAVSGYRELGHPLDDFDLVFGYPWGGEAPMMLDLMRRYGAPGARLLLYTTGGVEIHPNRPPGRGSRV